MILSLSKKNKNQEVTITPFVEYKTGDGNRHIGQPLLGEHSSATQLMWLSSRGNLKTRKQSAHG